MEERTIRRHGRIRQLIKEETGKIILKDLDIDKNLFLTVTRVEVSKDLAHATIFVSTLKREKEGETLVSLGKHTAGIQHALNQKLRMRPVPKISFAIDKAFQTEQRMYDILQQNKTEE